MGLNERRKMKTKKLILNLLILYLFVFPGYIPLSGQVITSQEIDTLAERTLRTFDVPGIAVAVVKDGITVHSRGYGVRSLNSKLPVNEYTLFGIASNTKAFTTTALGILVDEKKLKWDDRVIDYIPEFRLYNPYVTQEFTIRDLLTHRSGLGLGAGDLMVWPGGNNFTINDILYNIRYLKPVSGFRSKYDYDNLLYLVAGQVVARVSKMSYEDFIEKRIMEPLQMKGSAASYSRLKDKSNVIDPHVPVNGSLKVIERYSNEVLNAAGGIYSNITDMCKWVNMHINNGKYGTNHEKQLVSERVHKDMWSPNTIIPVGDSTDYNTHFSCYGLGWGLSDVKGYKRVGHTGGLAGIVTQVTIIPEMKLAIIVFTNQQSGAAFYSITNSILDKYFGISGIDRIEQYSKREKSGMLNAEKITEEVWKNVKSSQTGSSVKSDNSIYTGTYTDNWFGEVTISEKNGTLWFDSKRSPHLTGEMFPFKGNTYLVKWNDRSMDADAYVMFCLDKTGKAFEMKMEAISPSTDFSYDFQDLDFYR